MTGRSFYDIMIVHYIAAVITFMKKHNAATTQKETPRKTLGDIPADRLAERDYLLKRLTKFTLLSDVFMSVVFSDLEACQHAIRILSGDSRIRLKTVRTQYAISKAVSHGARLDVLAEDMDGRLYHMEIEGSDTVDHARRTRFYSAMTDSETLRKGSSYSELPRRHIFYISGPDIWKGGYTVYEEEKRLRQTGQPHDDGVRIAYVNTAVNDGSRIAKLMDYFKTADPFDDSEGELSKMVRFLKTEERGMDIMCEIMDQIREDGKQEGMRKGLQKGLQKGLREGRRKGKREGRRAGALESSRKAARNLSRMGMPAEMIAQVVEKDVSTIEKWLSDNGGNAS